MDDQKKETCAGSSEKTRRTSDIRIAVISGACAVFGVCIGALITGYFSIQSQRITAEQQAAALSRKIVQGERQELKKALFDYSEVVTEYYRLTSSDKLTSNELDGFAKKAFRSAFYITVAISVDLGQKTFEVNQILLQNLKAKTSNEYSDKLEEKAFVKFAEWVLAAKAELKVLEYKVSPENLSTDLLRLLFRGSVSSSNDQK